MARKQQKEEKVKWERISLYFSVWHFEIEKPTHPLLIHYYVSYV
jgi:hypothetical protein